MSKPVIKVQKIHPDAIVPSYAYESDAGADLFAVEDTPWQPLYIDEVHEVTDLPAKVTHHKRTQVGCKAIVKTGLKFSLPAGYEVQVRPRSGNAAKFNVSVLNTPGTVDNGYRGEIMVIAWSIGNPLGDYKDGIKKGAKIAQMVIAPYHQAGFEAVESLDDTQRGENALNSSKTYTK